MATTTLVQAAIVQRLQLAHVQCATLTSDMIIISQGDKKKSSQNWLKIDHGLKELSLAFDLFQMKDLLKVYQ